MSLFLRVHPGADEAALLRARKTFSSLEMLSPEAKAREGSYILSADVDGWTLFDSAGRKLRIDFDKPGSDYQRRGHKGKSELIARALGSETKDVVDLSAGLGQDAVFLCQLGFSIHAVERDPRIGFLLKEALLKTERTELRESLTVTVGSSEDFLKLRGAEFDAAFFDPMYPQKKKSALPRQEMVLFRSMVGADEDAVKVAAESLKSGPRRLIVKRPDGAEPLLPNPVHSFEGKTVRYDLYVRV